MKKHEEKTLVLLAFVCILIALVFQSVFSYFTGAALTLLFINLFVPPLDKLITRGWLAFSTVVGHFNTKIILTLIWYVFLVPVAFIRRKTSNEDLLIENPEEVESFWVERDLEFDQEYLRKGW